MYVELLYKLTKNWFFLVVLLNYQSLCLWFSKKTHFCGGFLQNWAGLNWIICFLSLRQDYVYPDAKDRQFLRYFYKGAKKKQFNVEKYNKLKDELEQVTQLLYLRLTISEFKSHSHS